MTVQGTINELLDRKISVNAVPLDQAMMSVLIRIGIGRPVGEGEKPPRGKAPKIYAFNSTPALRFVTEKD